MLITSFIPSCLDAYSPHQARSPDSHKEQMCRITWTKSVFKKGRAVLQQFIYFWVDYSLYKTSPMFPRVGCTNSQALPRSELTAKSLSFTASAPRVSCCNGASSDWNKFFGCIRNWTGDPSYQSPGGRGLFVPNFEVQFGLRVIAEEFDNDSAEEPIHPKIFWWQNVKIVLIQIVTEVILGQAN